MNHLSCLLLIGFFVASECLVKRKEFTDDEKAYKAAYEAVHTRTKNYEPA